MMEHNKMIVKAGIPQAQWVSVNNRPALQANYYEVYFYKVVLSK